MAKSLDRITLIVPTYHRRQFLGRLAHFYSAYPVQLIIADGTEGGPWAGAVNLSSNIQYIHRPGDSIFSRFCLATKKVTTPYAALLGDDEFQLPSGLARSAAILDADASVNTSMGSCIGFNVTKHGIVAGSVYGYQPKEFSHSLPGRIEDFFLHYSPTIAYALWRSEQLATATSLATAHPWGSGNLGEWIQAFCGACQGNHIIHDQLQWLRSDENPPQQAQLARSVGVSQWWADPSFEKERHQLLLLLGRFLEEFLNCKSEYVQALISYAFSATAFSEQHNKKLQLLGLKPAKNYNRNYTHSLAKLLKSSMPLPPSEDEIARVVQSISLLYQQPGSA